jgi:hypothetical protein
MWSAEKLTSRPRGTLGAVVSTHHLVSRGGAWLLLVNLIALPQLHHILSESVLRWVESYKLLLLMVLQSVMTRDVGVGGMLA